MFLFHFCFVEDILIRDFYSLGRSRKKRKENQKAKSKSNKQKYKKVTERV